MFEIKRYTPSEKNIWNGFLKTAKNATMLFEREYMDYHSDRFHDHSLMVYRKGNLFALVPANEKDGILYSHQGLTYGGLIISKKAGTVDVLSIFNVLNEYLKSKGIVKVVYKLLNALNILSGLGNADIRLVRFSGKLITFLVKLAHFGTLLLTV